MFCRLVILKVYKSRLGQMKKLPKIITQEEFEQLFEAAYKMEKKAKSKKYKNNLKQYRIAMLLGFEGGMRISEIVGLEK